MAIKIKGKGRIDEKSINAFEIIEKIKLPQDYRKFLIENNGAIPEKNIFDISDLDNESGVRSFLSFEELKKIKKEMKQRLLPNAWIIADDDFGNYICIVIGENKGIYFWDHEYEQEEGKVALWDNMFFLSDNFTKFLNSLKEFNINDMEVDSTKVISSWIDPNFKPEF